MGFVKRIFFGATKAEGFEDYQEFPFKSRVVTESAKQLNSSSESCIQLEMFRGTASPLYETDWQDNFMATERRKQIEQVSEQDDEKDGYAIGVAASRYTKKQTIYRHTVNIHVEPQPYATITIYLLDGNWLHARSLSVHDGKAYNPPIDLDKEVTVEGPGRTIKRTRRSKP